MLNRNCGLFASGLVLVVLGGLGITSATGQNATGSSTKSKSGSSSKSAPGKSSFANKKPTKGSTENPFPKRVPAGALDGGQGWLNTSGDISLKDLRGKIVLLDFWTYCCINCMHILPDLTYLEEKFPNELVVIGVHSGKFDNEKDSENIRRAILRYEIKHPVLNDANMSVWRKYNINTWPSFALIDPEGNFCGVLMGEGNRENLDFVINRVIAYHKAKGTLDETPIRFDLESAKAVPTPLRFPGKVLADEASNRLFISDSNHHRIVVTDLLGKQVMVIGSGIAGKADGPIETAQFDHPQGIDLDGDTLFVADTENHLIRAVDLQKKSVATIAGTGQQSRQFQQGGRPLQTALASPWDVKKVGDKLFIAMAGFHQIWVLDGSQSVRVYAGSGREDILNGPLNRAALAQPSGLATNGDMLYVVDSEGSAVRQLPVAGAGPVATIVGTSDLPQGRCLFEFGDIDGIGNQARLQHPLGIVHHKGKLYVADTYNHKIKVVDLAERSARSFLGVRQPGNKSASTEFSEPAGLSIAGEKLYIADTNNHRIRVYDFATQQLSTLELTGVQPPAIPAGSNDVPAEIAAANVREQSISAVEHLTIQVELQIPEGFKRNQLAPVVFQIHPVEKQSEKQTLIAAEDLNVRQEATITDNTATIKIPLAAKTGKGTYKCVVTYSYCRDGRGGVCKFKTAAWNIPIAIDQKSDQTVISLKVE